jgi:hypothetical protein
VTKTRYTIGVLLAVQLAFLLLLQAEFLTDWDSYLYTYAALHFQPVGLAGGRWFFTAVLGVIWRLANVFAAVEPDSAWRIFSAVMIVPALANAGLFFALARRWLGREDAVVAGCLFVSSLLVGVYGSSVMTETLTVTCLLGSLLLVSRPPVNVTRVLLAGTVFGLGCTMREPLILLLLLPLGLLSDVRPGSRWLRRGTFLAALVAVLLVHLLIVRAAADDWPEISKNWAMGMTRERLMMAGWLPKMLIVNFLCLAGWLILFSPFLLISVPDQIRMLRTRWPFWMGPLLAGTGVYGLGQIANHTLVFNPRFIIFPGVLLLLPAAAALRGRLPKPLQHPWLVGGTAVGLNFCLLTVLWPLLQTYYFDKSRVAHETYATLAQAPDRALFVPGTLTPAVDLYKNIHGRAWRIVYAGWDFSDKELLQEVEASRQGRRPAFIVEPAYWAEKRFRPMQYQATESIWTRYLHHPSFVAHFSEIDFPPRPIPVDFFRRLLNFLFS